MTLPRRLELILGTIAGILGLVATGVLFFAPLLPSGQSCTTTVVIGGATTVNCANAGTQHISLIQSQPFSSLVGTFLLFVLVPLGILCFALFHSLRRGAGSLSGLWLFTLLQCGLVVLALPSIGWFYFPTALLAVLASVLGTLATRARTPTPVAP